MQTSFTAQPNDSENFRNITLIPDTGVLWVSFVLQKEFATSATIGSTLSYLVLSGTGYNALFIGDIDASANVYGLTQQSAIIPDQIHDSTKAPTNNASDLLVAKITFVGNSTAPDQVELFVNPTPGTTPPAVADATMSDLALSGGISQVGLYSRVGLTGTKTLSFDEIRIGTTYEDVAPVPEPGSVALILAGGFYLAGRRRRA